MSLHISKELQLPDDAVTQTFAILAKRGVGKTYTASVMVEEMLKNMLQVVVVDPIGVWWGLRSSADSKDAGMAIIIAGGEHADIPLDVHSGEVIAELIVDQRLSIVLDLSLLRKGEQKRFMIDFAETLYHKNRTAMHLVLDEADEFAPQRPMGDDARLLGAIEDLVRRGRARGIGVTMITQRPAVLNKNVLTQIEVLVAMRLTSPQDRAAIAEWIKYHADAGQANDMLQSLGSLPIGSAWFWSPGWLDLFQRVAIRRRETFDSSSTPAIGEQVVEHGTMAAIDIGWLRERLSATIEKAEAEDPKLLRKRIAELERRPEQKPVIEYRERIKEVLPEDVGICIDMVLRDFEVMDEHIAMLKHAMEYKTDDSFATPAVNEITTAEPLKNEPEMQIKDTSLGKAERLILSTLAQFPNGRTRQQVAIMTGYSHKGGGFQNALGSLRTKGFIAGQSELQITAAGREAIGPDAEALQLPTGQDLLNWWYGRLPLAPRKILEAAAFKYPKRVTRVRLAEMAGYQPSGGGFQNALGRLRTLGLIEGSSELKASDDLFQEVGNS